MHNNDRATEMAAAMDTLGTMLHNRFQGWGHPGPGPEPGARRAEVDTLLRAADTIAGVRRVARLFPARDYWDRHFARLTLDEICDIFG